MKILVTGFEPFGGESVNPSYEAVCLLPDNIGAAELVKMQIPTSYAGGVRAVAQAVAQYKPAAVLSVGQAGGRACVTVEKVAINYADAPLPDNDGCLRCGEAVVPGGPAAYFATVPVKAMVQNVIDHGYECAISYSAEAYVCNCVMYSTLHLAAARYPQMQVGFIHVPYSAEQLAGRGGAWPCMPVRSIAGALGCAVEAVAMHICSNE